MQFPRWTLQIQTVSKWCPATGLECQSHPRSPTTSEHEGSAILSWHNQLLLYLKFVPNCAQVAELLCCLLRKDVPWKWTEAQTSAFVSLKEKIASSPVLAHFDPAAPTIVTTDASVLPWVLFCLRKSMAKTTQLLLHPRPYLQPKGNTLLVKEKPLHAFVHVNIGTTSCLEGSSL